MGSEEITGQIHSIESFGALDGPGIRLVIFFQGCPMRCLYCHNPDTWKYGGGQTISAEEVLRLFEKNRPFYRHGGITASGGEPLMQPDFLLRLFTLAKKQKIHTCLDTSGILYHPGNQEKIREVIACTDLVLLDVKHADPRKHRELTGHPNEKVYAFLNFLDKHRVPVWIRHVLVPGLTDDPKSLHQLGQSLAPYHCIKVVDVLPYHTMGMDKYRQLKMEYPLKDTPQGTKAQALVARQQILMGMGLDHPLHKGLYEQ